MTQEEFEIQRHEIPYALTGDYSRNRRRAKEVFRSRKARVLNIKDVPVEALFHKYKTRSAGE